MRKPCFFCPPEAKSDFIRSAGVIIPLLEYLILNQLAPVREMAWQYKTNRSRRFAGSRCRDGHRNRQSPRVRHESTVPGGNFAKAALVGAKTVKGPGPCRVSTRPAALTAATSVVWSLELTAFWIMFLEGYMGEPPTVTVWSLDACLLIINLT
jgi:hypothetical protein